MIVGIEAAVLEPAQEIAETIWGELEAPVILDVRLLIEIFPKTRKASVNTDL
jgi:hypothetical protein